MFNVLLYVAAINSSTEYAMVKREIFLLMFVYFNV